MAVTVQSQPQAFMPVYNPQWFVATSTQTGQPNFRYTVVLTDLISSGTITQDVDADPSGNFRMDVGSFAEQYMTQVSPSNLFGFQLNVGAIRKVRVNIGETYDVAGTPTYFAGSNVEYIVWNASLDFLTMFDYAYTNYVMNRSSASFRYLTSTPSLNPLFSAGTPANQPYMRDDKTYEDRSHYLYCINPVPGTHESFQRITITGYNSAGTPLATTVIANPYAASATYTDKYAFIDIGYEGLENMPGAQIISGANPIPVSTFSYYDVFDTNTGAGAGGATVWVKRMYVVCEPKFDLIGVHYLADQGQFDTQVCAKLSLRRIESVKSHYSKLPYRYSGYNVVYDYTSAVENTLTSSSRNKLTVNTDWLEEWEASKLKEAISSPIVYVDLGDTNGMIAMKMVTGSYDEKKKYNEQMFFATFELEYAHINIRQRA